MIDSKIEIKKLKKEVDSNKARVNTKDIELKKSQNKSSELQLQLDEKTKENMQILSKFKSLEDTLNSYPIKKQTLEIKNLEQDLINKELKSKILKKELGCNDNIIQENKELKEQIKALQLIGKENIKQQVICTAKSRIHNQLSYKLGKAMIENSKSLWGYIRMPYVLSYIKEQHKKEQIAYNQKIKTDPNAKLPPLESYPDYQEALKEKECLTYKLGEAMIEADKSPLKLGYITLWFKCKKIQMECKKR